MDGMELICFKIISAVGEAKSNYILAMQKAADKRFDEAQALIKEGEASYRRGHEAHASLIQQEASGDPVTVSLLLMHAEDQLMAAETTKLMAEEIIRLNSRITELEQYAK